MSSDDQRRQAVLGRIRTVRRRLNLEVLFAHAVGPFWVAATAFVLWRVFVQRWGPVAGDVAFLGAVVALRLLSRAHRVSTAQASVIADRQADAGECAAGETCEELGCFATPVRVRSEALECTEGVLIERLSCPGEPACDTR